MTDQELSFDESNAQSGPTTCSRCQTPLTEYWAVDGAAVCESCKDELLAEVADPAGGAGRLFKAIGLGLLGMLGGAAVWYAVAKLANLEIGIIAILLGFLVGKGIMMGSGNRGGLGYQLLAVAITYLGIGVAMAPFAAEALMEESGYAVDSIQAGLDSLPDMVEEVADSMLPTMKAVGKDAGLSDSALDAELAAIDSAIAAGPKGEADPAMSTGLMVGIGLVAIFVGILALPVLSIMGGGSIIGLIIYGIALYEAWKLTAKVERSVSGPHPVGDPA
jgi:hypothetical protein